MKIFVSILLTLTFSVIATAGLDNAGRFDEVVAIYRFEDENDSGPREFDGSLWEDASIVDTGKIDKCLRLRNADWFGLFDDQHLGVLGEFSIVAWIKLPKQWDDFRIAMVGTNDDETLEGSIFLQVKESGNIEGIAVNFETEILQDILTEDENVSDNQWHHIAFTKFAGTTFLFIDGEVAKKQRQTPYIGFVGDDTFITIAPGSTDTNLTGSVFLDEVGFFEIGFSIYEIKGIYDNGLSDFLEAMPVNPQEKMSTTWGELKRRRF